MTEQQPRECHQSQQCSTNGRTAASRLSPFTAHFGFDSTKARIAYCKFLFLVTPLGNNYWKVSLNIWVLDWGILVLQIWNRFFYINRCQHTHWGREFPHISRLALGHNLPHMQCVLCFWGVERQNLVFTHPKYSQGYIKCGVIPLQSLWAFMVCSILNFNFIFSNCHNTRKLNFTDERHVPHSLRTIIFTQGYFRFMCLSFLRLQQSIYVWTHRLEKDSLFGILSFFKKGNVCCSNVQFLNLFIPPWWMPRHRILKIFWFFELHFFVTFQCKISNTLNYSSPWNPTAQNVCYTADTKLIFMCSNSECNLMQTCTCCSFC